MLGAGVFFSSAEVVMRRARLALLVLVAALLTGARGGHQPALRSEGAPFQATDRQRYPVFRWAEGPLQGNWTITSVQRDGRPDPKEVGGSVMFAGDTVTFQPSPATVAFPGGDEKDLGRMALR
jgi:hypothetical protein